MQVSKFVLVAQIQASVLISHRNFLVQNVPVVLSKCRCKIPKLYLNIGQDFLDILFQILDLKVGTRQYGDGASSAKKQSKNAKVAGTTRFVLIKISIRLSLTYISSIYMVQTKSSIWYLNLPGKLDL